MKDLTRNIVMWRTELERQEAGQGVMMVFNSMCVYLGEQHRAKEIGRIVVSDNPANEYLGSLQKEVFTAAGIPAEILRGQLYQVGDYVVRVDGELHSTKKLVGQIEWIYHEDDIGFKFNDFRLAGGLSLLFSEVRHATQEEIQQSEAENNGE